MKSRQSSDIFKRRIRKLFTRLMGEERDGVRSGVKRGEVRWSEVRCGQVR